MSQNISREDTTYPALKPLARKKYINTYVYKYKSDKQNEKTKTLHQHNGSFLERQTTLAVYMNVACFFEEKTEVKIYHLVAWEVELYHFKGIRPPFSTHSLKNLVYKHCLRTLQSNVK